MSREYQKYEFCKAVKCYRFKNNQCTVADEDCPLTAKELHHWLKDDGFKIIKESSNNEI